MPRSAPIRRSRLVRGLAVAVVMVLGVLALHRAGLAAPVKTGHVSAELVAETASAAPGAVVHVALHQVIQPGWHTYWRNPGDAGQATTLAWTLPPGWRAGPIVWPAPGRFLAGSLMNYVYTGEVYLPVPITVAASAHPGGTATLKAVADWLVCRDVCVPETATLSLELPIAAGAPSLNGQAGRAVAATLAATPKLAGLRARFQAHGDKVTLSVAGAALEGLGTSRAYFYPYDGMAIEQASPQSAARGPAGVTLALPAGYGFTHGKPPARLEGVLSLDGEAFEISAEPGAALPGTLGSTPLAQTAAPPTDAAASAVSAPPTDAPASTGGLGLVSALALAFAGGLVLNLMPCVFPVLSIKAAALAHHLEAPAKARGEGVAFLLGVVASFLVLAGLLIAARAAGQSVGWGFQLQSPFVVAALVLVLFAAGLNLSGVFEAGLSLQGVGAQRAARASGLAGAALTGVLAVVVAAPCTAPFMAPAIGWALVQPPVVALAVFLALGLGLAAPFTLIAFTPALSRRLPRPGAWMEGLRKLLAFPMYAAAAWFAWVMTVQGGDAALLRLLAAALAVAFAAFCWGVAQRSARTFTPRAAAVAALLGAGVALAGVATAPAATAEVAPRGPGAAGLASAEPWSEARVNALQAQGRPVFVDFTAAWCVTCQVNERAALSSRAVSQAFARTGATYLKADWTRPDPTIAAALAAQGRSGVPLYLVYSPHRSTPVILPQLLTGGAVVAALEAAAHT